MTETITEQVYPCPPCYYCKATKTWDTTRYVKGQRFLNEDACIECFNKSVEQGWYYENELGVIFDPTMEVITVEEQIKMCGETFDQRQTRHLAINQTNICCLGCGEVLWNLRYDADKKILKLISGGLKGYVCGDDSNPACAPEDEEEDEDEEDEEEEAEEAEEEKNE